MSELARRAFSRIQSVALFQEFFSEVGLVGSVDVAMRLIVS